MWVGVGGREWGAGLAGARVAIARVWAERRVAMESCNCNLSL